MLNLAMNAGILSSIFNGIKSVVEFIVNIVDILKGLFTALIIYLYAPIYYLLMGICSIVNFAEMLFKKFAGIDPIMTNDGPMNILDVFVKSNEIWGLFVSILVLSIVLLFLFTIVAIIKSEFAIDAKGSAKGPIIARSLKSLAMFIIVPVVSLLGVYATNAITDTVNSMMKGSDDTGMVQQIFYTMAYNANKARINKEFANYIKKDDLKNTRNSNGGAFKGSQEDVAYAIDMAFKSNQKHKSGLKYKAMGFPMEMIEANDFSSLLMPVIMSNGSERYSIWDLVQVNFYYSILDMDYVIGFGSAIVITYLLLSMCVVLLKRIFEIVILLLLAAPMIALAPLDGGSASKSWQKEFMKRVISIVAPVFSINMYFIMIPLFMKISIFNGGLGAISSLGAISMSSMGIPAAVAVAGAYAAYDALFQIMAICVGMSVVKTSQALLCNLLGIEDLVKSGQEATKKAVGTAVQVAAMASGVGGAGMAAVKGLGAAAKGAAAAGKGNRLAGLKAGWQSTAKDRGHAMELLKDKTMGSDIVKNSAFGQLLDKSTYTNMGKTNKEIDAEKRKKEKMKDQEATEAATASREKASEQSTLKTDYETQVATSFKARVAPIEAQLGKGGEFSQENVAAAKGKYDDAHKKAEEWRSKIAKAEKEGTTLSDADMRKAHEAEEEEKSTKAERDRLVKGRKDLQHQYSDAVHARENAYKGIREQEGEFYRDETGTVRFKSKAESEAAKKEKEEKRAEELRPERAEGTVDHNAIERGAKKLGESLERLGDKIANSKVGQAVSNTADAVGDAVGSVAGKVGKVVGSDGAQVDAMKGAEMSSSTAGKALLEQTAIAESATTANTENMSEQVEKGVKEASHDLARAIRDAMQSGKLNVDGINQLRTSMDQFNKQFMAAQKNDQTGTEMIAAIEELKKTLEGLTKK